VCLTTNRAASAATPMQPSYDERATKAGDIVGVTEMRDVDERGRVGVG
jgi:hypothetical protein